MAAKRSKSGKALKPRVVKVSGYKATRYKRNPIGPHSIVAYTGDADVWCPKCAVKRYGDLDGTDREGNPIRPIYNWDSEGEHCGGCRRDTLEMWRKNPPADWPSASFNEPQRGKYDTAGIEALHAIASDGANQEGGDVEGPGYFWLVLDVSAGDLAKHEVKVPRGTILHAIVQEDNQGFVYAEVYRTRAEARKKWAGIERELDAWYGGDDGGEGDDE